MGGSPPNIRTGCPAYGSAREGTCRKRTCRWWIEEDGCSVPVIAQAVKSLVDALESVTDEGAYGDNPAIKTRKS